MYIPEGYEEEPDCRCGLNKIDYDFVSDSILGLSIKPACCIHDWQYGRGRNESDRAVADRVFLRNMLYIIDTESSVWILKWIRRAIAYRYYEGVRTLGRLVYRPIETVDGEASHAS